MAPPPVFQHCFNLFAHAEHDASQIDVDTAGPGIIIVFIGCHIVDPRVVERVVKPAKGGERRSNHRFHLRAIAHITTLEMSFATLRRDLRNRFCARILLNIADQNRSARRRKAERRRTTNTAARAGNQRDLPVHSVIDHDLSLHCRGQHLI